MNAEADKAPPTSSPAKCHQCGTPIEPGFDACWKCGTTLDGEPAVRSAAVFSSFGQPYVVTERAICAACGYDLRGIDSDRCPECGKTIDRTSEPPNSPSGLYWFLILAVIAALFPVLWLLWIAIRFMGYRGP